MSNENLKEVDVNTENLDEFNDLFHGRATEKPVEEAGKEEEEIDEKSEDDSLANEEQELDVEADEDDSDENSETDDQEDQDADEEGSDEEEKEDEKPKAKKKTAQDRINEITAARREAERKADMLEGRLAEMERRISEKSDESKDSSETESTSRVAPNPDDKNEKGEAKYPLAEFDPEFIRDLTKFEFEELAAKDQLDRKLEEEESEISKAQEELNEVWVSKVEEASEKHEDFQESVVNLEDTFQNLDQKYSEYLANTIMQSEYGTEILYHLSQNLDEAQSIVDSGATKATLAIGRLEANFASDEKQPKPAKKVTKAKKPPTKLSRGAGSNTGIADDTDDLAAFEKKFFN